jgi:enoyl-CoA hydratase
MSSYKNLKLDVKNNILYITINRPDKLNALNFQTLDEIGEAMHEAYDNHEVKGIIITGEGEKAFVAGADISEFTQLNEINSRKISEKGQDTFNLIEKCPKPVLAAVNGFALGGGCELALACHMRVASDNAKMGLPEVTLGILPGYGGTQRLTLLVGKGKSFEMIMTGDMINAEHALHIGLVNYVVPQAELMAKCEGILAKIIQRAPIAVAQIVECVNAVYNETKDGYEVEANSFAICTKTEDFKEGTAAFLAKRKPEFKGK